MDYPKSVPSAGLSNGRFVDEDPLAGKPGSLIPASWGNGVTQELLNVIQAAGIVPSEALYNQLLTALRGSGLFLTAPLFDNSRAVATTEYVLRSGMQYGGFDVYNTGATLTLSNVGGVVSFASNTPVAARLPATAEIIHAATVKIVNAGSGIVTVSTASAVDVLCASNGAQGTITIGLGETAEFIKLNNQWRLIGGTVALKYSAMSTSSLQPNGWKRTPDTTSPTGYVIEQWGVSSSGADANGVLVTFPMSFPNAVRNIVVTDGGPTCASFGVSASSLSQFRLYGRDYNGAYSNWTGLWRAIGY
ncbi:gp53-like domain-containing protein [Pseudomonas kilonensis]|uniref:gp53-like domain-containing protein n=1 Tax=Pseudomonas kilonensis TaxID=132476 RepID=UPI000464F9D9|nr:hypothetical protein [Pseudomonas kilonensis]